MSINGMSILKGATGITLTGGTAAVFEDDGKEVKNGIHVVDTTVTDFLVRPYAIFSNRAPLLQKGVYTKGYREVTIGTPFMHTDDTIKFPVYRGKFEIPPEATAAQILELKLLACQSIMDAELVNFYQYGSVK